MSITTNTTTTAPQDLHLVAASDDGQYSIRVASDKLPRGQRFIGSVQVTGLESEAFTPFTNHADRSVFTDAGVQQDLIRKYTQPADPFDPSKGLALRAFSWDRRVLDKATSDRATAASAVRVFVDQSHLLSPEALEQAFEDLGIGADLDEDSRPTSA